MIETICNVNMTREIRPRLNTVHELKRPRLERPEQSFNADATYHKIKIVVNIWKKYTNPVTENAGAQIFLRREWSSLR